jgi:hypothetical protein
MKHLRKTFTLAAAASILAGAANAQMDYHGFDKETVDALNEKMEQPLNSEQLEVLSAHRDLEVCGGSASVAFSPPEGWDSREDGANPVGGDVVMPIPTTNLAPDYPAVFDFLQIEGMCEAVFSVTDQGQTSDILAN